MPRIWIDTMVDLNPASGVQQNVSLMTGVSSTQTRFDRMTLLRTIIGLDIAYEVRDSGDGSQDIALGIGVTSQEAFAASILPDPETATDFPAMGWVWRNRYRVFGFLGNSVDVFTRRLDLDLRSQRKLENGEAYLIVTNTNHEGFAATVDITGIIRQLWLVG